MSVQNYILKVARWHMMHVHRPAACRTNLSLPAKYLLSICDLCHLSSTICSSRRSSLARLTNSSSHSRQHAAVRGGRAKCM